jgi:hypothetical protein
MQPGFHSAMELWPESQREGDIAIGHQHGIMHMKARVEPGQHRLGVHHWLRTKGSILGKPGAESARKDHSLH